MSVISSSGLSKATHDLLHQLEHTADPAALLAQLLDDAHPARAPGELRTILGELEQLLSQDSSSGHRLEPHLAAQLRRFVTLPRPGAMHPQLRVHARLPAGEPASDVLATMARKGLRLDALSFHHVPSSSPGIGAFKLGVFYQERFVGSIDVVNSAGYAYPMLVATIPEMRGKGLGAFLHVAAALILQERFGTTLYASDDNSALEEALWDKLAAKGMATVLPTASGPKRGIPPAALAEAAGREFASFIARQSSRGDEAWLVYPQDRYTATSPNVPTWALRPGEY